MNLMIRQHEKFELEYNCSFYSTSSLPEHQRTHKFFGILILLIGILAELLYMPCLYGLWKQACKKNCCYRLMLIMALSDMLCLPITAFISAYFSLTGKMFCDSPRIIYVAGIFGFACWANYCIASVELAINRCMAFTHYYWLFDGWIQYVWVSAPLVYASLIFAFARAPIYNGIYGSWIFNPHLGYFADPNHSYQSVAQIGNNFSLSILLPSIYFVFYIHHSILSKGRKISKREYSLFLQVLILNIMLAFASISYVIMQFIDLPVEISFVTHVAWIINQASPPFVYLTLNDTIRNIVWPGRFKIGMISTKGDNQSDTSAVH